MPDSIFSLSARDRADFFQAAVARVGRNAILLEKDVWVVWALRALFEDPVGAHLVFKGGTSLSKAHRLIERFSEDVDLTYDIRELAGDLLPRGPGGEVLDIPTTPSQVRRVSDAIRNERLPAFVRDTVAPIIQARLERDGAQAAIEIAGCNLSIRYAEEDHGQVKSAVLLEFGARATGEPADVHDISCDSAAAGLNVDLPTARPRVMKAERTFWEKATAVHVFCRSGDPVGDHKARHWYDLERLDANAVAAVAIADVGLAAQVATHKSAFFRERDTEGAWIDYHAAVRGGLQLVPVGPHLAELEADYAAMQADGLLPVDALAFARLMSRCDEFERAANAAR
jgi:Nucleotidyl transferase AbiEii toxin, Type IV TA system